MIEQIEQRLLLTGIVMNGQLQVAGTTAGDTIIITQDASFIHVTVNQTSTDFAAASITSILIDAMDGSDLVLLQRSKADTSGMVSIAAAILGGPGNDVLYGGSGSDLISGGDGNDELRGGPGLNTLNGDAGADALIGGPGNDFLDGGADNDTFLFGGAGNDTVHGGLGNDVLNGGTNTASGADELFGDKGTDTVDYSGRTDNLKITLDNVANDGGNNGLEGDNVHSDIENIIGGIGNDRIVGNVFANSIQGNKGNDTLYGGAANDTLRGGDGRDLLFGQDGDDVLDGGDGGLDTGYTNDSDSLSGGAGSDTADYSARPYGVNVSLDNHANDGYPTRHENDNVMDDVETVLGGSGYDQLRGSRFDNLLVGNGGNDYLRASFNDVPGDTSDSLSSGGNDTFMGGAGDDFLDAIFATADKTLIGGDGNDRIRGGFGNDSIDGGDGTDTVDYGNRGSNLFVQLPEPGGSTNGNGDTHRQESDTISNIENVVGGSADDMINGNSGPNTLDGRAGKDTINGGGGDDNIFGGSGSDLLNGGPGNDFFVNRDIPIAPAKDQDTVSGGDGVDLFQGDPADTILLSDTEVNYDPILSPTMPLAHAATALAAVTQALAPGATVNGSTMTITGTAGNDVIAVRASGRSISVAMNGTVQNFSQGIINRLQIDAGAGNDSLTLSIPKGVLANRITAMINGGPGNDVLAGGAEADFFEGIAKDGSDTMTGGDGLGDAVFYTTRTNPVSVTLDGKANDGEAGENDMVGNDIEFLFGGSGKDTLSAGPYSETIVGGAGNDELTGGPQSDFLVGSGGNDTTYGGKGTDYFKLSGDGASDRYNIGPVDPGQPTTDQLAIDPTASGDLFKDRPI